MLWTGPQPKNGIVYRRRSAIFIDGPELFSGELIQTVRGINKQGFDEISPVLSEEMR